MTPNVDFEFRDMAFNQRMLTFAVVNREHIDVREFLMEACEYYENEIRSVLQCHLSVKVNTCFAATFEKTIIDHDDDDDDENRGVARKEKQDLFIQTCNTIVERDTNLRELFEETVLNIILKKLKRLLCKDQASHYHRLMSWWFKSIDLTHCEHHHTSSSQNSWLLSTPLSMCKTKIINVSCGLSSLLCIIKIYPITPNGYLNIGDIEMS